MRLRPDLHAIALSACAAIGACHGQGDAPVGAAPPGNDGGAPPLVCPPGTLLEGVRCRPAGIEPGECPRGFTSDGRGGCDAILPQRCEAGTMAVPGDTVCRPVADCGEGDYGNIPVEPDTVYVDAHYAGGGSDGTRAHPWTNLVQALAQAPPGVIVALAAGVYRERGFGARYGLQGRRLWGRCPALVEVQGQIEASPGLVDRRRRQEVHTLTATSSSPSLLVLDAEALLDRVLLRDGPQGLAIYATSAATRVVMTDSLVEGDAALVNDHSELVLRRSMLRGNVNFRGCLTVHADPGALGDARVVVEDTVFEGCSAGAITNFGGRVDVFRSVFRDNAHAVISGPDVDDSGLRPQIRVVGSLIERSAEIGVLVGSGDLLVDTTTFRDSKGGKTGITLGVVRQTTPSHGWVTRSLLEDSVTTGLAVVGSSLSTASTIVRRVAPGPRDQGFGIYISKPSAPVAIRGSVVEDAHVAGIGLLDGIAHITDTAVRLTHALPGGRYGDGILALTPPGAAPSRITLQRCLVEGSERAGLTNFGGVFTLDHVTLECNAIDMDGEASVDTPFVFGNAGDTRCGCGEQRNPCQALSVGLTPPQAR